MSERAWPSGQEWPEGALPQPSLTLELSALELLDLADSHLLRATSAARAGDDDTQLFFEARASYLRQRVAAIAPHLLVPGRKGTA